ncbi:STAS domain-containing protein [Marinicella sp. S1101]|uniref:STAS domain-containing protein n=1 Tax=Marinicella marina TaxID=2996016 RepID=UPI002260C3BC|nr:STAS domain-containing protein [Marinicella marina]MCX7552614.1 STAS domain-containing protein [Marinicella marina]MDJ1139490.1 STAS domain-containing protein [Marinicella marina]
MSEFIRFDKTDDLTVIYVNGEVDLSNSAEVRKTILAALKTTPEVKVDLSGVEYIDSSGIAAMVEGLQFANSNGRSFSLTQPSAQVKSIMELARLDQVFTIE